MYLYVYYTRILYIHTVGPIFLFTNWLTCLLICVSDRSSCIGVCVHVRVEGRELPGVGALAICICRCVCHGGPCAYGGGGRPGCGASLALATSCGKSSNSIL